MGVARNRQVSTHADHPRASRGTCANKAHKEETYEAAPIRAKSVSQPFAVLCEMSQDMSKPGLRKQLAFAEWPCRHTQKNAAVAKPKPPFKFQQLTPGIQHD